MPGACELALRFHGASFHILVDLKMGEGLELIGDRVMVGCSARGVAGFEQERQARGHPARLDSPGDFVQPFDGQLRIAEPRPGRVVQEDRADHG